MEKYYSYLKKDKLYLLWVVIATHVILAILYGKVLKNHDHVALTFTFSLPTLGWGYLEKYNAIQGYRIILKVVWEHLVARGQELLGSWEAVGDRYLNIFWAFLMSGLLYGIMQKFSHYDIISICADKTSDIDLFYLILSVPCQQLVFFILPASVLRKWLPTWFLFIMLVLLFGNLHNYYPDLATPILAGVTLGIPSAWLILYKKDPIAACINHAIVGTIAIKIFFLI